MYHKNDKLRNLQLYFPADIFSYCRTSVSNTSRTLTLTKKMNAVNDFEIDFLKLMINSVYRKIMENFRKRIKVRLVNNAKDFLKYTSSVF